MADGLTILPATTNNLPVFGRWRVLISDPGLVVVKPLCQVSPTFVLQTDTYCMFELQEAAT